MLFYLFPLARINGGGRSDLFGNQVTSALTFYSSKLIVFLSGVCAIKVSEIESA
ncbi:hypothetical protein SNF32_08955 [Enterococcus mundtii]|nr:hypothetical protein [Enterococcus mundtii]